MTRKHDTLTPLFEDDSIIAFNKPSGLLCAPDRSGRELPDLITAIHEHLSADITLVNRIDRGSSGIVLCAKDRKTQQALRHAADNDALRWTHLAIISQSPAWNTFEAAFPIQSDPVHSGRMRIHSHGKDAATDFTILKRWRRHAMVECIPHTERRHQIRMHLAHIGHAIAGDNIYGNGKGILLSAIKRKYKPTDEPETPLLGRLALHCQHLSFKHPVAAEDISITAPMPHDFLIAIKYLDRFGT